MVIAGSQRVGDSCEEQRLSRDRLYHDLFSSENSSKSLRRGMCIPPMTTNSITTCAQIRICKVCGVLTLTTGYGVHFGWLHEI